MKLGTKGLCAIPHGKIFSVLKLATRGPRYLRRKVKNLVFWPFWGISRLFRAHKGGQGPHKACPSILGSAGAHARDFCPPQVYVIGVQVRLVDFCSPQVYASSV